MTSFARVTSVQQAPGRVPWGFVLVVAMHVAFVVLLNGGLQIRALLPSEPPPLELTPFADPQPPVPPETWDPDVRAVPIDVVVDPPPVVPMPDDAPLTPARTDTNFTTRVIPADDAGTTATELPFTPVSIDSRHPLTQPPYPPAAIRLGETGSVELELTVDPRGRVTHARVVTSSGSARLDAAAVEEALRNWRLIPAQRGGDAIVATHRIRVAFRLEDR